MAKSAKVSWEPPPPKREERYDWSDIADQLRQRPMEWAKVFEDDKTSLVTAIRINGIRALRPDKGFETRTANNKRGDPENGEPRTCTLWLRYNPAKDVSD